MGQWATDFTSAQFDKLTAIIIALRFAVDVIKTTYLDSIGLKFLQNLRIYFKIVIA